MRPIESDAVGDAIRVPAAPTIVLIGFQSMGNLGLGYLAASLRRSGYDVRVLDIELPEPALVTKKLIFGACGPCCAWWRASR